MTEVVTGLAGRTKTRRTGSESGLAQATIRAPTRAPRRAGVKCYKAFIDILTPLYTFWVLSTD